MARGLIAGGNASDSDLNWAALMRREARARLDHLITPGTVLCLPTTPFPAPIKGLSVSQQETVREQILCLCSYGGLTGVPSISIPGATVDGAPVGLSLLGARGSDAMLVGLAAALEGL